MSSMAVVFVAEAAVVACTCLSHSVPLEVVAASCLEYCLLSQLLSYLLQSLLFSVRGYEPPGIPGVPGKEGVPVYRVHRGVPGKITFSRYPTYLVVDW